jgi:energy-coupling factor transporter ATP-binding protein EcfA2
MELNIKNTNDIENQKIKVLVYGDSGAGKTTLTSTVENCLIISAERGLLSVKNKNISYIDLNDYPVGKRIEALRNALIYAKESKFDWIALDSITEIAQILISELKIKYPQKKDAMNLWGEYNDVITSIIKAFRDIDKHVLFLALAKAEKDESGMRFVGIDMAGKISDRIEALFDEVLYLTKVSKDDVMHRVLLVETDERYKTKDRSGMLNAIEKADLAVIQKKILG